MDLQRQLDRQKELVKASYALHTTLDLDELLGLILDVAAAGVGADRGTVFLLSRDGEAIWSRVLSGDESLEIRLPVGQGLAGSVAQTGETIRLEDAYADERFDRSWDEQSGYRTRQVLCAPIRNRDGAIVGVFQLLNKIAGAAGAFDDDDEEYLAALSVHAALAVENARLHRSALEKERFDREVQLAQGVQRQLQPERAVERLGAIAAAGMNELCEDATGDYYDLLPFAGRLAVVIGDVSGHGLQAALLMAETRAYLRAFVSTINTLPRALELLNDALVPDMEGGKFISLFAAVIDDDGTVEWCNAGHNPPLLLRASGELTPLTATGRILGILEGAEYSQGAPIRLEPGDVLLLYTDGVTEARRGDELFGMDRLADVLRTASASPPAELLDVVRAEVEAWTRGAVNDDDLTMVVVKNTGD